MTEESTGEFNLAEAAEEIIAEGESQSNDTGSNSDDSGQAEAPGEKSVEEKTSPEDILNQLGKEQANPSLDKDFIDSINKIGAIHNGVPVTIESKEQLVELIQKGFDYTKKTMAHADEVKAKLEEFSKQEASWKEKEASLKEYEQKLSNTVTENNIMESIVEKLKIDDPDLFAHIAQLYQAEQTLFERNKPIQAKYDGALNELRGEIQSLRGQKQTEELSKIKSGWESELKEVQTATAAQLALIGVKPNWDKVKDLWSSDASGKMTVKAAMLAAHGEDILKGNESYKKLLETKNKTQSKFIHRTGVGESSKQSGEIKATSYEDFVRQASNEI